MRKKWNLLIIFIVIALVSFLIDKFFDGRSICLFYNTYGVACPSCGMTRSYIALLHGDFHKAIYFHPLFWAVPLLLIFYKKKRIFYSIALLFIVVWIIRLFLYFPTREPFNFNENAIFPKLYRTIKNKF